MYDHLYNALTYFRLSHYPIRALQDCLILQCISSSEIYEVGASTDEDTEKVKAKNDRQLESIRRRSMSKDTAAKRIMKESVTIESAKNSFSTVCMIF